MVTNPYGPTMARPIDDSMGCDTAFNDAAEVFDRLVGLMQAAKLNDGVTGRDLGERAKALDELVGAANFFGLMRDVLLRQLARQGWRPTVIERTFGVCKPTVSRALRG